MIKGLEQTEYIVRVGYSMHPVRVWIMHGRALFDWRAWRTLLEASFELCSETCSFSSQDSDADTATSSVGGMPAPRLVFASLLEPFEDDNDAGADPSMADSRPKPELVTLGFVLELVDFIAPPATRANLRATLRRLEQHAVLNSHPSSSSTACMSQRGMW